MARKRVCIWGLLILATSFCADAAGDDPSIAGDKLPAVQLGVTTSLDITPSQHDQGACMWVYVPVNGATLNVLVSSGTVIIDKTKTSPIVIDQARWVHLKVVGANLGPGFAITPQLSDHWEKKKTPWGTYWWSTADEAGFRFWRSTQTYTTKPGGTSVIENGTLKKYDQYAGAASFAWEVQNRGPNNQFHGKHILGFCGAEAVAGFMETKPVNDRQVGSVMFRENDREGLAVQLWEFDHEVPGNFAYYREHANAFDFHDRLYDVLVTGSSDNASIVVWDGNGHWNYGIYKANLDYVAWDWKGADKQKVDVKATCWYRQRQFNDPGDAAPIVINYTLRYTNHGNAWQAVQWREGDLTPWDVWWPIADPTLVSPQMDKTKLRAIIANN